MDLVNLSALPADEISHHASQISADEIKKEAAALSPDQILALVGVLSPAYDKEWRPKLSALIESLKDYKALETVGKGLIFEQALELLNQFQKLLRNENWKFSPLIVGMSHGVFTEMLIAAKPEEMQTLKEEVITEPVQHQMTLLTHEVTKQIPAFSQELENLEKSIRSINARDMSHREMLTYSNAIQQGAEFYEETLNKINKLLALAWNTNRSDLIEKLSHAKEMSLRILNNYVGHPRTLSCPPTGLFDLLDGHLNLVYGNPEDPLDIEAVDDDEPALEALSKFSIWYLHDYWNIGLLPHIVDPQLFEPVAGEQTFQERQNLKEKLMVRVKKNLNKIGLKNAKDLKQAGIFSKHSLQEYISRHAYLLK